MKPSKATFEAFCLKMNEANSPDQACELLIMMTCAYYTELVGEKVVKDFLEGIIISNNIASQRLAGEMH